MSDLENEGNERDIELHLRAKYLAESHQNLSIVASIVLGFASNSFLNIVKSDSQHAFDREGVKSGFAILLAVTVSAAALCLFMNVLHSYLIVNFLAENKAKLLRKYVNEYSSLYTRVAEGTTAAAVWMYVASLAIATYLGNGLDRDIAVTCLAIFSALFVGLVAIAINREQCLQRLAETSSHTTQQGHLDGQKANMTSFVDNNKGGTYYGRATP